VLVSHHKQTRPGASHFQVVEPKNSSERTALSLHKKRCKVMPVAGGVGGVLKKLNPGLQTLGWNCSETPLPPPEGDSDA
jgi:hypothetical protein